MFEGITRREFRWQAGRAGLPVNKGINVQICSAEVPRPHLGSCDSAKVNSNTPAMNLVEVGLNKMGMFHFDSQGGQGDNTSPG